MRRWRALPPSIRCFASRAAGPDRPAVGTHPSHLPPASLPGLMSNARQPIGGIGTGYVGLVTAAGFAELCSDVWCVDSDAEKIPRPERVGAPIHEPVPE